MAFQSFSGKEYLKIDIANNFGLDKEDWDVRIDWFDKNQDNLMELVKTAETPALFYAAVQAWYAVQRGEPIGYPISLDATASGYQLLACLTGDRSAASLCNVIDAGKRQDAYTVVYQAMLDAVGGVSAISRNDTKKAIMTALYGSEAEPKKIFGTGKLLGIFESTMGTLSPAVWSMTKAFLKIWNPNALVNSWVLPDNCHIHVKVMAHEQEMVKFLDGEYETIRKVNKAQETSRSLGPNCIHSIDGLVVRELGRRCDYDPALISYVKQILVSPSGNQAEEDNISLLMVKTLWTHYEKSGFLSARILDYIHSDTVHAVDVSVIQELLDSLPKRPFKVLTVHDCMRCLPHYGNDIRLQYNNLLMLIAKSDMLSFILTQITGQVVTYKKLDPDLWKDIMESNYSLS
jgi:chloramphenicol O-acetyltransferase